MIRPFVPISIFLSLGILLGWAIEPDPEIPYLLSISWLLLSIPFLLSSRPSFLFELCTLIFFMNVGTFFASVHMRTRADDISRIRDERLLIFQGRAISDSVLRERSISFVMRVKDISLGGYRIPGSGKALVSLWVGDKAKPISVRIGDEIVVLGKKRGFTLRYNPGEPRWDQIFMVKGIRARISARKMVIKGNKDGMDPLSRLALSFRDMAMRSIRLSMPDPLSASIMEGLLLGRQEEIPPDLREAFRRTNTIHVLVVSGGNVAMVSGFVYLVLRILGFPWFMRYIFALISIFIFSLATGMEPSVTRASAMAAIWIVGVMVGRRPDPVGILALALFLILLFSPLSLLDLGFILSLGAVLSIILLTPILYSHLSSYLGKWAGGVIGTSLAAQLGVAPILANYFNTVSLVSPISNILVVPLAGILTPLGLAIALLAPLFPPLGKILGILAWSLIQLLVLLVKALSGLPGSILYLSSPPIWAIASFYILLGSWPIIGTKRWLFASGSALAFVILFSAIPKGHKPYLLYLNVGQGSSTAILTSGGKRILIDGGPSGSGKGVIMPFIRDQGENHIDLAVITHPHEDHIGGILEIIEGGVDIGMLVKGEGWIGTKTYRDLILEARRREIRMAHVSEGSIIDVDDRTRIRVLGPGLGALNNPFLRKDLDDLSLVLMLEMNGMRFLFPGDIGAKGQEMAMSRAGKLLRCDLLLLPHHGDYERTTQAFLQMCHPHIAVAQVGLDNPFGLPDRRTVNLCESMGIKLYRSDLNGPVRISWEGDQVMITSLSPPFTSPIRYAFSPKSQRRRTMASASSE